MTRETTDQSSEAETGDRARETPARDEQLMQRLIEGDETPRDLARSLNMTMVELVEWAGEPNNIRRLAALARLSDLHAQLVVTRYRANAALQLIQLAMKEEGGEIARKACVDLLRTELPAFDRAADNSESSEAMRLDTKDVLETLERLGRSEPAGQ